MKQRAFSLIIRTICLVFSFHFGLSIIAIAEVPRGFESLYSAEKRIVNFRDTSGNYHLIEFLAGYDSVTLINETAEKQVRSILQDNQLKGDIVNKILADLKTGVSNKTICEGDIGECIYKPSKYEFWYDYYTNRLYFFLNPEFLQKNVDFDEYDIVYARDEKSNWALINHLNIYSNMSHVGDPVLSIYDQSILGLKYGNLVSDIQYQGGVEQFKLNELFYNYENEKYRYLFGLSRNGIELNSTDFLNSNHKNSEIGLTLGTSKNLMVSNKSSNQKLFYYAPHEGVLRVYRDERILLQKSVPSGQGYITNDELPSGRYNAIFEVSVGDEVISKEIKPIYNSNSNNLAVGSVDTDVTLGLFQSDFDNFSGEAVDFNDEAFIRALITYRPTDEFTFGVGTIASEKDALITMGANVMLPYDSELTIKGDIFNEGGYYYDVLLNSHGWLLSYEELLLEESGKLAQYLYNTNSYKQLSLSKSFRFSSLANGYMNYSYYENNLGQKNADITTSLFNLGLTVPVFGKSTFQANLDYDLNKDNSEEAVSVQLSLTVPLGSKLSAESRVDTRGGELYSWRNSLKTGDLFDYRSDAHGQVVVAQNYLPNTVDDYKYDASFSGNFNHDSFNATGYAYTASDGVHSTSIGLSSSQIITKSGFVPTSQKASSYLVVDSGRRLEHDTRQAGVRGLLVLESDDTPTYKNMISRNKEVVPLRNYQKYVAYIDTESVDLTNTGERSTSLYTTPGSVKHIKTNVSRVLSFVSGFRDIFENEVMNVSCDGTGCVDSESIVKGIYKITVKEKEPFTLVSNDLICYIPPVQSAEMFNFGYNYCVPDLEPMGQLIAQNGDNSISLTFVGGFDKKQYLDYISEQSELIARRGYEVIEKNVGEFVFVYVKSEKKTLTAQQMLIMSDLQKYVLSQTETNYILVKN